MSLSFKSLGAAVILCTAILMITGMINGLPWWLFAPLLTVAGVIAQKLGWRLPFFFAGFLSGFLAWGGMEWFYATSLHDIALHRLAVQFSVSTGVLILGAGLIGGMVAGLAFFAGKMLAMESNWNICTD